MPFKSQKQRNLMYAAADKKGGAAGVSQSAAKKMVADDPGGKLPERSPRQEKLYGKKG